MEKNLSQLVSLYSQVWGRCIGWALGVQFRNYNSTELLGITDALIAVNVILCSTLTMDTTERLDQEITSLFGEVRFLLLITLRFS